MTAGYRAAGQQDNDSTAARLVFFVDRDPEAAPPPPPCLRDEAASDRGAGRLTEVAPGQVVQIGVTSSSRVRSSIAIE
jgi:hypothetical protein